MVVRTHGVCVVPVRFRVLRPKVNVGYRPSASVTTTADKWGGRSMLAEEARLGSIPSIPTKGCCRIIKCMALCSHGDCDYICVLPSGLQTKGKF